LEEEEDAAAMKAQHAAVDKEKELLESPSWKHRK